MITHNSTKLRTNQLKCFIFIICYIFSSHQFFAQKKKEPNLVIEKIKNKKKWRYSVPKAYSFTFNDSKVEDNTIEISLKELNKEQAYTLNSIIDLGIPNKSRLKQMNYKGEVKLTANGEGFFRIYFDKKHRRKNKKIDNVIIDNQNDGKFDFDIVIQPPANSILTETVKETFTIELNLVIESKEYNWYWKKTKTSTIQLPFEFTIITKPPIQQAETNDRETPKALSLANSGETEELDNRSQNKESNEAGTVNPTQEDSFLKEINKINGEVKKVKSKVDKEEKALLSTLTSLTAKTNQNLTNEKEIDSLRNALASFQNIINKKSTNRIDELVALQDKLKKIDDVPKNSGVIKNLDYKIDELKRTVDKTFHEIGRKATRLAGRLLDAKDRELFNSINNGLTDIFKHINDYKQDIASIRSNHQKNWQEGKITEEEKDSSIKKLDFIVNEVKKSREIISELENKIKNNPKVRDLLNRDLDDATSRLDLITSNSEIVAAEIKSSSPSDNRSVKTIINIILSILLLGVLSFLGYNYVKKKHLEQKKQDDISIELAQTPTTNHLNESTLSDADIVILPPTNTHGSLTQSGVNFMLHESDQYVLINLEQCWQDTLVSEVYFHHSVITEIYDHARDSLTQVPVPEVGGFLLGNYKLQDSAYEIVVEKYVASKNVEYQSNTELSFGAASMLELDDALNDTQLHTVGWFHTHPGHDVFLSSKDIPLHEGFFVNKWQIAMVLDSKTSEFKTGLFSYKKSMQLNNRDDVRGEFVHWTEQREKARQLHKNIYPAFVAPADTSHFNIPITLDGHVTYSFKLTKKFVRQLEIIHESDLTKFQNNRFQIIKSAETANTITLNDLIAAPEAHGNSDMAGILMNFGTSKKEVLESLLAEKSEPVLIDLKDDNVVFYLLIRNQYEIKSFSIKELSDWMVLY